MSAVDWVCKKISLESASEQLSAITISRQQVLPSKPDACANVTTCCFKAYDGKFVNKNVIQYRGDAGDNGHNKQFLCMKSFTNICSIQKMVSFRKRGGFILNIYR